MTARCLLLSSLLLALSLATGCERLAPALPAMPPPPVTVALPLQRTVIDYEETTGRLAPVEAVEVRARVSGYLDKVDFQQVDENTAVALKDTGTLREGDEVKEGAVLFEIDDRPYAAVKAGAQAELDRSKALLTRAISDARRAESLRPSNAISQEEYERFISVRNEADATVAAAQARLDAADLDFKFTKVKAPISGRLGRALVTAGNLVTADVTPLTTIVREDPIYAYFDLPEQIVLRYKQLIREKKFASVREEVLPVWMELADETGFPHRGVIDFVDNRVDVNTATLRLRGVFDNPVITGILRRFAPGNFVRVRIPASQPYEALLVSERAITVDLGERVVYVVDKDNVAHRRAVKLGSAQSGGLRVITEGLEPTDQVVAIGVQRVRDDVTVKPELKTMPGADVYDRQSSAAAADAPPAVIPSTPPAAPPQ